MYLILDKDKVTHNIQMFLIFSLILIPFAKICFSEVFTTVDVGDSYVYFSIDDFFLDLNPMTKTISFIGGCLSLFFWLYRSWSSINKDKDLCKIFSSLKKEDVFKFIELFEEYLNSDPQNKILNLDRKLKSFKNLINIIETLKEEKENFLAGNIFLEFDQKLKIKVLK